MMKMKRLIAFILSMLMMLSVLSGCVGHADPTELSTAPTIVDTEPEETEPTQTEPQPTESAPDETESTETEPTVTEPTETKPEETEPTEKPVETEPTTKPTEPRPTVPDYDVGEGSFSRAELEAMDTTKHGYGQGVHVDDANRPHGAMNEQKKYGEYDAYFIAPDDGNIYLTFDEGYENGYTAKILDVLKAKDVKAVFFVTMDYCESEPELVQRMIDEGHAVGNHSVNHKSMPTLSVDKMVEEVMVLHDYVKEHFGYEMHLFRPPMGEYSQQSLAVLQNLGYKTVEWSFAYYDYDPEDQPEYQKAYDRVVGAAHSGAIYLLHAVSKTNTDILGDVIDEFRRQGFNLVLFS